MLHLFMPICRTSASFCSGLPKKILKQDDIIFEGTFLPAAEELNLNLLEVFLLEKYLGDFLFEENEPLEEI